MDFVLAVRKLTFDKRARRIAVNIATHRRRYTR
jgi:hypothetical protein